MKIVSAQEMARIERHAYDNGADESVFMEAAGRGIAVEIKHFVEKYEFDPVCTFLCAKGNNSGDAYVAAALLKHAGFETSVFQLTPIEESSPLCQEHHARYRADGVSVVSVNTLADCSFPQTGIIVDGLFGTGFKGTAEGLFGAVIEQANQSGLPIIAIDIPSGLNGQTGKAQGPVIQASETVFLGLPKTGFFVADGWNYVGDLIGFDFGLDLASITEGHADALLLDDTMIRGLLPPVIPNRHKYQVGTVVGLAGSPGMPGAAILAAHGAMRAGAGLTRLLHPDGMQGELAGAPPEVIRAAYQQGDAAHVLEAINVARAAFIGPGLGRDEQTEALLGVVLKHIMVPVVLDADALYWLAESNLPIPANAILTPHLGEMRRLLGTAGRAPVTLEFLQKVQEFVEARNVTVVLKGGPSFIFYPGEMPLVSPRGDPGMASGGSGDVLTGVIAALLAQGMGTRDAAAVGTYLHGTAGELAADEKTSYGLIASDIIENLPYAFSL